MDRLMEGILTLYNTWKPSILIIGGAIFGLLLAALMIPSKKAREFVKEHIVWFIVGAIAFLIVTYLWADLTNSFK